MNWSKIVVAGLVAGVVGNLYDFAMHGFVMADTYLSHPDVFAPDQASPLHFLLVSVCLWLTVAMLFAKTRSSWASGWKGGAVFGTFVGLVMFFPNFYHPMVLDGFPYHLSWCWGGIGLLGGIVGGSVLGAIYQ